YPRRGRPYSPAHRSVAKRSPLKNFTVLSDRPMPERSWRITSQGEVHGTKSGSQRRRNPLSDGGRGEQSGGILQKGICRRDGRDPSGGRKRPHHARPCL